MRTRSKVRKFCIEKLAQILYECVACSDTNRAMLDWLAAERFVNANETIMDSISDEVVTTHKGQVKDFETFDRLYGRTVWDKLYQPMQKAMGLPYRPTPHYTHILFS